MAAPKKAPDQAKTEFIRARVTLEQKQQVLAYAAAAGLNEADFVRLSSLTQPLPEVRGKADPALAHALSRIGNNVNQLAKSVHLDTGFQQYWHEIGEELRFVLAAVLDEYDA